MATRIIISVLIIGVVAYLVYQYMEKKKAAKAAAMPTLTVNFVNPKTNSRIISGDLTNGLDVDQVRVTTQSASAVA